MPRPVLRSERLELRPMLPSHLPLLHQLDSDPQVMRYLIGRARTPREIDDFWGPVCADTEADARGLGWWVAFESDVFVGWWDLSPGERGTQEAEIGWRVLRSEWRRGLATEGARALLTHGFETLGLTRVWAETMAVNTPSRGVMEKLGMRHVRTEVQTWDDPLPGSERGEVIYEITASSWSGQQRAPRPSSSRRGSRPR